MRNILGRAALVGVIIFASKGWLLGAADVSGSNILAPAAGALLGQYYGAGNLAQTTAKLGANTPRSPHLLRVDRRLDRLRHQSRSGRWTHPSRQLGTPQDRLHQDRRRKPRCHDSSACKRLQSTGEEVLPRLRSGDEW
jgi:hypothetical protein